MAPELLSRSVCLAVFAGVASLSVGCVFAEVPTKLPEAPDYVGEIRRSADGKLVAVQKNEPAVGKRSGDGASKATMRVGKGEKIATLTEAARLARDGEVIEIRAGNYRGQPAIWTQNDVVIRGVGGRPVMLADGRGADDTGIWVVRGGKVRIENVEFRGARSADGKGAGIRFDKGQLTIHGCRFADNETGILTGDSTDLTLAVFDSEFADAPRGTREVHHLLSVGAIGKFMLSGSRFHNGFGGHLVKSRARESRVLYNMLVDGAGGHASYELEFANGGMAYVIGNVIGQSADTENPVLIAYGTEGARWPDNAIYLSHNTLINDRHAGTYLSIGADKFTAGVEVWAINNLTVGNGDFFRPAQGRFEGNHSALRGELIEYGGSPARLTNPSPLRGTVRLPGSVGSVNLQPTAQFNYPVGSRPIRQGSALSPGAFQ